MEEEGGVNGVLGERGESRGGGGGGEERGENKRETNRWVWQIHFNNFQSPTLVRH